MSKIIENKLEETKEETENTKIDINKKKRKLKIRITALFGATIFIANSSYALIKLKEKRTIDNASIDEIATICHTFKSNGRNIEMTDELIYNLKLIERYINISIELDKLYNQNKDIIHNLDKGTIRIDENGNYISLTEEELSNIELSLEKISKFNSPYNDEKNQLIGNIVKETSNINAYLNLEALKVLKNILIEDKLKQDVASFTGTDKTNIEMNFDSTNTFERISNNNEYSYTIPTSELSYNLIFSENLFYIIKELDTIIDNNYKIFKNNNKEIDIDSNFYLNNKKLCCRYNENQIEIIDNYINIIKELPFYRLKTTPITKKLYYDKYGLNNNMVNMITDNRNKIKVKNNS